MFSLLRPSLRNIGISHKISRVSLGPLGSQSRVLAMAMMKRDISTTPATKLIYKRVSKIKKAPEEMEEKREILKSVKSVSDIEDIEKIKSLANNKYYNRTPLLLKPYMRSLLLRPYGFVLSIVLLQQFLSIIPFLLLWYVFETFDIKPLILPENLVVKGVELMHNGLINWDNSLGDKEHAELSGAYAYATIRVLGPVIWISSILFAPFFDKLVLRSISRMFKNIIKRKQTPTKPSAGGSSNDNIPPEVRQ